MTPTAGFTQEEIEALQILEDPVKFAASELGWEAREYQEEMLHCTKNRVVIRAGRRIGKTDMAVIKMLKEAFTNKNFRILIVTPFESQIKHIFQRLRTLINESDMLKSSVTRDIRSPNRIEFGNGSYIVGFTAGTTGGGGAASVRGQGADLIYLDEADYLSDDDIDTIISIAYEDAEVIQIWATSTPTGRRGRFWEWCLVPGTEILLPNEETKPVEDIQIGDKVIGAYGDKEEVRNTFIREVDEDIIKISAWHLPNNLELTGNHEILTSEGWKNAEDIKTGDFIKVPAPKLDDKTTTIKPQLNDHDLKRLTYIEHPGGPTEASRELGVDRKTISTWRKKYKKYGLCGLMDARRRKNHLKAIEFVNNLPDTKEFAYLSGLYLAEGHIKIKEGDYFGSVAFTFHKDEKEYIEKCANYIKSETGVSPRINDRSDIDTTIQVIADSAWLAEAFNSLFKTKEDKEIPPELMRSKHFNSLVESVYDGDGHKTILNLTAQKVPQQIFHRTLLNQTPASLGFVSRDSKKDCKWVNLLAGDRDTNKFIDGNYYVKVKSIERIPYNGPVYNFETSKTHTYVANYIGVHNCTKKELGWHEFHYTSHVNPNWTEAAERDARNNLTEMGYVHEILAEFGDMAEGVFQRKFVEKAKEKGKELGIKTLDTIDYHAVRTVGIDWDKAGAATQIVVTEYDPDNDVFYPIHRAEIPRGEFTYHNAIQELKIINEEFNPAFIYADRGHGEYQIEAIHKFGMNHPETGLADKVKGISFSDKIRIPDPHTKEIEKKHIKPFMVNTAVLLTEQGRIALPVNDSLIEEQMLDYYIERITPTGRPIYNDDNEHALDAFMLSLLAMQLEFTDIAKSKFAKNIAAAPRLDYTQHRKKREKARETNRTTGVAFIDSGGGSIGAHAIRSSFNRSRSLRRAPKRKSF